MAIQHRPATRCSPLRIVLDRDRGGAYLAMGLAGHLAMFGVFLFLTYYLQQNLGFSPIKTGLRFLPMSFAIIFSATTATTRLPEHRPAATDRRRPGVRRDRDAVLRAAAASTTTYSLHIFRACCSSASASA